MSLFKKASWAKASTNNDNAGDDRDDKKNMFSHSSSYSDILADQERQRKLRVEKQKSRAQRLSSTGGGRKSPSKGDVKTKSKRKSDDSKRVRSSESPKRRRLGSDKLANDETHQDDYEEKLIMSDGSADDGASNSPERESWNKRPSAPKSTSASTQVIDLGGSSDEDEADAQPEARKPAELDDLDDESDEELAALARQARARRKQSEKIASATPDAGDGSPFVGGTNGNLPTPPLPDPTIKLFITSSIPNTQPLMVLRRLSQRLQEARIGWCKKQGFDDDFTQDVFFVHRMRRTYDVTTCRSLGLESDADGNVTMKGADGKEGVKKVHLEAVTSDLFEQMKKEKTREELKKRSQYDPEAAARAHEEAASEARKEEGNLMRLVLKAKGKSDFRLKVKPTTIFSKIENACRKNFKITDDQEVHLEFDGERLDSEEQVQSTDIDDMDCIDVYIS